MTPNMLSSHPEPDEIIGEVRANRDAYAARFGYDVRTILRRSRERAAEDTREAQRGEPLPTERGPLATP